MSDQETRSKDPVLTIPRRNRLRYFPRRGHRTWFDRGFQSKKQATEWIREQYDARRTLWTAGWMIQFVGQSEPIEIVDRNGRVPKL